MSLQHFLLHQRHNKTIRTRQRATFLTGEASLHFLVISGASPSKAFRISPFFHLHMAGFHDSNQITSKQSIKRQQERILSCLGFHLLSFISVFILTVQRERECQLTLSPRFNASGRRRCFNGGVIEEGGSEKKGRRSMADQSAIAHVTAERKRDNGVYWPLSRGVIILNKGSNYSTSQPVEMYSHTQHKRRQNGTFCV